MKENLIEIYLDTYDLDGKSVDEVVENFNRVFHYDLSKKEFLKVAYDLGYDKKQIMIEGNRFYSVIRKG